MKGNILLEPFKPGTLGTGLIKGFLFNLGKTIALNTPSKFRLESLSRPFIIEVKTDNAGDSNDDQFQFTGALGDYDVVAKQGGSVVDTFNNLSDEATITLSDGAGTYTLEVTPKESGGFNRLNFNDLGDKNKMLDTKNWGNIVWDSFENAFYGCNDMTVTATDVPNLSSLTSLAGMFRDCFVANPDVSAWNTSNVTNMEDMFWDASNANPDVSNWDTSNVTQMGDMFREASNANPNVSNWDVGNVIGMATLFAGSNASPNVTNWDVSSCEDMRNLFGDTPGNPNVSNWDVSSVERMGNMFKDATNANPDCRNWDVRNLNDAGDMLKNTSLSSANLDAIYINWSALSLRSNVDFGAGTIEHTSAGTSGRNTLINTYGWTISDGGINFDADYQAVLDYGTAQGDTLPSSSQQAIGNDLVIELKSIGVWNKIDSLAVYATDGDNGFSLIDWKRLSKMTIEGTVVRTQNEGWKGNGTDGVIDSGYKLQDLTQFDPSNRLGSFGAWAFDRKEDGSTVLCGDEKEINQIVGGAFDDIQGTRSGVFDQVSGLFLMNIDGTNGKQFINGTQVSSVTVSSAQTSAYNFKGLKSVDSSFSNDKIAIMFSGGDLSAEQSDFYDALETYMDTI